VTDEGTGTLMEKWTSETEPLIPTDMLVNKFAPTHAMLLTLVDESLLQKVAATTVFPRTARAEKSSSPKLEPIKDTSWAPEEATFANVIDVMPGSRNEYTPVAEP